MTSSTSRTYRSPLRAEQAAATRERVVDAAARLFAEHGYARTTLAAIAAAADVSIETVQTQGAKRELLGAALLRSTIGRTGYEPLLQTAAAHELVAATSGADFARAAAEMMTRFNASTAGIWRAFSSAAANDPEVEREWSAVLAGVRTDAADVVALVQSRGWARTDVDTDDLVASAWVITGPETYERLTGRLGWSAERYSAWLARSIADLLFG